MRIPRIIHTAWFGEAPWSPVVHKCWESRHRYLPLWGRSSPGWTHRHWSDGPQEGVPRFKIEEHPFPFVQEAYRRKRWAFVSDYIRLYALYHHGGIYLDMDVEVLRPLDQFLWHRAFTGHEADLWWLSATMGAEPGHPWIRMLLDHYETAAYDETPNTQVVTELSRPWLEQEEDGTRYLREGVVVYPTEYFASYDHQALRPIVTENSYTSHLFAGSWLNGGRGRV